jgi:putative SOS response-associated peptidase YedK
MCGRFTRSGPVREVAKLFELSEPPTELAPRYNVAPSQVIAVVGLKPNGNRGLAMLKWGFVPHWSNDPKPKIAPINARAETLLDKPMFREAFQQKRCLIPADGFYEWAKTKPKKTPYHIRLKGGGLFAFAGLWDVWKGDNNERVGTCCIITTAANELVQPLHERMPVILRPDEYAAWLDDETPMSQVQAMLRPYPAEEMEIVAVGPLVNSPKYDQPECVTPAA